MVEYLDMYNDGKSSENAVLYTDLASTITSMTKGIMNGITIVLIAFAAISLVVSIIMICIITYASVLERTKEIGILKALGARRKGHNTSVRRRNVHTWSILGSFGNRNCVPFDNTHKQPDILP